MMQEPSSTSGTRFKALDDPTLCHDTELFALSASTTPNQV
jgi:hypothetical protein